MVGKDFQKDYRDSEGVLKLVRPFSIKTRLDNDTLAILVHGLTSTPYTMTHLAEFLAEKDIDVEAVLLAGHGGSFEMLEQSSYHDWIDSVDRIVSDNIEKYNNIFLIGHSLGANMSIELAIKYPMIKGVVSLGVSVFLRYDKYIRFFLRFYKWLGIRKWKKRWVNAGDIKILKEQGGRLNIPTKTIIQFYNFIDHYTKKNIHRLKTPILISHSRYDEVSHPKSSEFLFKNINIQDSEIFILDKNNHGLLHKTRRDFLFGKVVDFIRKHS